VHGENCYSFGSFSMGLNIKKEKRIATIMNSIKKNKNKPVPLIPKMSAVVFKMSWNMNNKKETPIP
jgi:hypothetical protein